MSIGFIITRHVNNEKTNDYWNRCIICIRRFYSPEFYKIVVIDDNSNYDFVKKHHEYKNVEYVQSEFPKRGELLPYYYFYKNHYFEKAVIIHDSVFFHIKVNFRKIKLPVLPLWHFDFGKEENIQNSLRITSYLKNNKNINDCLLENMKIDSLYKFNRNNDWNGCFGVQSFINHKFLCNIQNKYNLFSILNAVHNRSDRCCLERIMGAIFNIECRDLIKINSLLGVITNSLSWGYNFDEYINDLKTNNKSKYPVVKVWTGR